MNEKQMKAAGLRKAMYSNKVLQGNSQKTSKCGHKVMIIENGQTKWVNKPK